MAWVAKNTVIIAFIIINVHYYCYYFSFETLTCAMLSV